jgi:hypothetical protein
VYAPDAARAQGRARASLARCCDASRFAGRVAGVRGAGGQGSGVGSRECAACMI